MIAGHLQEPQCRDGKNRRADEVRDRHFPREGVAHEEERDREQKQERALDGPRQFDQRDDGGDIDVARVPQQRGIPALLVPGEAGADEIRQPLTAVLEERRQEEQSHQRVGRVREVAEETRGEHDSEEREQFNEPEIQYAQRTGLQCGGAHVPRLQVIHGNTTPAHRSAVESGSVTYTVVPLLCSLRIETSPPHMSTRLRTSVRPSPDPFVEPFVQADERHEYALDILRGDALPLVAYPNLEQIALRHPAHVLGYLGLEANDGVLGRVVEPVLEQVQHHQLERVAVHRGRRKRPGQMQLHACGGPQFVGNLRHHFRDDFRHVHFFRGGIAASTVDLEEVQVKRVELGQELALRARLVDVGQRIAQPGASRRPRAPGPGNHRWRWSAS